MGSWFSRPEVKYQCLPSENELCTLSISLSRYLSAMLKKTPFKLKLIYLYFSIYEKLFGPWGRVVGSYSDSLCISSSDIDIMVDHSRAYTTTEEIPYYENQALIIYTDDADIPPGCCWLGVYERDVSGNFGLSQQDYMKSYFMFRNIRTEVYTKLVNVNGFSCLSSRELSEKVHQHGLTSFETLNKWLPNWQPHGPAFKQTYFGMFEVDIIQAFFCRNIPKVLLKWTRRNRKFWPSSETINKALQQGCHVIGLPSKMTPEKYMEVEFRLGCGNMEKVLIESFNDCQKQCFVLLKIILKEYIEPAFPQDDILSSYTMKTLTFWMVEKLNTDLWVPENLLKCLKLCLEKLGSWIESEYCPNFFIPEYNIFRTKLKLMQARGFAVWFRNYVVNQEWRVLLRCKSTQSLIMKVRNPRN